MAGTAKQLNTQFLSPDNIEKTETKKYWLMNRVLTQNGFRILQNEDSPDVNNPSNSGFSN